MYVPENQQKKFKKALDVSGINFVSTKIWDGSLYQFSTSSDSLTLPAQDIQSYNEEAITAAIEDYRNFNNTITQDENSSDSSWKDTRFDEALALLRKNPSSKSAQEKVINLAVEFDSVNVAISILENRFKEHPVWSTQDINRLLTYYGWEGQSDRAYHFLDYLWKKYHDRSVIMLKEMMVKRYGTPNTDFQIKWAQRALELDPDSEQILRRLVQLNNSQELWRNQKKNIEKLVAMNPRSDTLYAYALKKSMEYEKPKSTIQWLHSFPDEAEVQLQPLAENIAYLYADEGDLTRAILWAEKTDAVSPITELDWLLQQKRYDTFIKRGTQYVTENPQADSLRTYVGQQLLYENFPREGYTVLYPLFKHKKAPEQTEKLVHSEIGYMNYEKKKSFYQKYPYFFSDSLQTDLKQTYRENEAVEVGAKGSFASDNFDNEIAVLGLFTKWGNRQKTTHSISVDETIVASDLLGSKNMNRLRHLKYQYQHINDNQTMQYTVGGGIYSDERNVRPDLGAGIWFAKDSMFTSAQVNFKPVLTNSAIKKDINMLKTELYREDLWLRNNVLQTGVSFTGKWYSNNVFSYEGLSRFYINLPFSTAYSKLRPLADLSYSDATTSYTSGVPYYTADNLFVKGVGIDYSYKDALYDPKFSAGVELTARHDNRDGAFLAGSARLSARIHDYWKLSLNGEFSTSEIYHYNNIGFSISYQFPKKIIR